VTPIEAEPAKAVQPPPEPPPVPPTLPPSDEQKLPTEKTATAVDPGEAKPVDDGWDDKKPDKEPEKP
jgi:hypothetical protein